MYATRYAGGGRISPGGAALALTVNGAILAGLVLFANPIFKKTIETRLRLIPIAADPVQPPPPPSPPKPQPKAKVDPAPRQAIDATKTVIVTRIPDPAPMPLPTFAPTPIEESGGGGASLPAKAPAPVLTAPTIDPRYADRFQPIFPPDEQRAGHDGRVVVRVLVGADGRVKEIVLVSATSDSFFAVTRKRALDTWRFKPATRDTIPVEAWREVAVSFVLNAGD